MLQITDTATEQLKKTFAGLDTREDVCLRLSETQEGLRIVLDQRRPGDATVKNDDEALLVIDAATAGRLNGRTMDFDESTRQLVFTCLNPRVPETPTAGAGGSWLPGTSWPVGERPNSEVHGGAKCWSYHGS